MHSPPMEYSAPRTSPWLATVIISILLHLLLFALISHYSGHKVQHNKPSPPLIVATLVHPSPVKKEVVENIETAPLIKEVETSPVLAEPPKQEVDKPVEELEATNEPEIAPSTAAAEPANINTEADVSAVLKEPVSLNYSVLGSGKSYMDAIEALKNQQLAAQASEAYQKAKTSPVLSSPQIDPFISEDEKFTKAIQLKTDCSNAVNLTVRVITGITGGLIQCSELPGIEEFVQQRLKQHTRPSASTTK
jgi:hypothetical protein